MTSLRISAAAVIRPENFARYTGQLPYNLINHQS